MIAVGASLILLAGLVHGSWQYIELQRDVQNIFAQALGRAPVSQWYNLQESVDNRDMGSYDLFAERAPYTVALDSDDEDKDRKIRIDYQEAANSVASFIDQIAKVYVNLTIKPKNNRKYLKILSNLVKDESLNVRVKHRSLDSVKSPHNYVAKELADHVPRHPSELFADGLFFRKLLHLTQAENQALRLGELLQEIQKLPHDSFQITLLLSYLVRLPRSRANLHMIINLLSICGEWKPHWLDPKLPTLLLPVIMDHIALITSEGNIPKDISEVYGDLWLPSIALMAQTAVLPESIYDFDESRIHTIGRVHSEGIRFPYILVYAQEHALHVLNGRPDFLRAFARNDAACIKMLTKMSLYAQRHEMFYRRATAKAGTAKFESYLKRQEIDEELRTAAFMFRAFSFETSTLMASSPYKLNYATKPSGPGLIFPHNFALLTDATEIPEIVREVDLIGQLLKAAPKFPAVYGKLANEFLYVGTSATKSASVVRMRPRESGLHIRRISIPQSSGADTENLKLTEEPHEADVELKHFPGVKRFDVADGDILIIAFGEMNLSNEQLVVGWFGKGRELLVNMTAKIMDLGLVDALILLVEDAKFSVEDAEY